jgi:hypothetical protein
MTQAPVFSSAAEAADLARAGLRYLAAADPTQLTAAEQTMLGCVYYPWSALHHIRWLQIAVLVNPMVYMSEDCAPC